MKRTVLLGLVAAALLLSVFLVIEYIPRSIVVFATQWTGLSGPDGVAIGDYDNDGLNDIAFTEWGADNVTVYHSDGTTVIKQWTGLGSPWGVAIGDYDNDGLNDLAFAEFGAGRVTAYRSNGQMIKQWTGLGNPRGVAIGDYDNDWLNDIAFTEHTDVSIHKGHRPWGTPRPPTIVTLRGTLTNATGYPIQSGSINVTIYDPFGTKAWHNTFDDIIDNGRYNIPLGTTKPLKLVKGQIYSVIVEVDADSPTFVSADVIFGDNNPVGDVIKFVAD